MSKLCLPKPDQYTKGSILLEQTKHFSPIKKSINIKSDLFIKRTNSLIQ